MGIYIPNMEMPKDCSYCKMAYDGAWCLLSEESNDCVEGGMMWRKCPYGGRPSWCPIVPIPEGHGRLGDLDALQEEFKKSHDGKRLMLIDTAPTIVPAEGGSVDEKRWYVDRWN